MSYFSEEIAKEAAATVMCQMVQHLVKPKETPNGLMPNGGGFHIIVGDKDGNILTRLDYGSKSEWTAPYDEIAESKFNMTVEHQKPTREIQEIYPELAESEGNTYYWGSWIDGGIVVACSGVDPEWDEVFSKMVVAIIRGMITKKRKQELSPGKHFREGFLVIVKKKGAL